MVKKGSRMRGFLKILKLKLEEYSTMMARMIQNTERIGFGGGDVYYYFIGHKYNIKQSNL